MAEARRRGRPPGSSVYRSKDERIIENAERLLRIGWAENPTRAFRKLLGHPDAKTIRRLQRLWKKKKELENG